MGVVRVRGLVALLVTLVALAGCNDPSPPQPTPTTSTPTTSSPTMSESTSPSPQPETAEQFIRRWVEASNEMQNTGETAEFLALGPECSPCMKLAKTVEGFYGDGGYVKTDGWRVLKIRRLGRTHSKSEFEVRIESAPTSYSERAGGPTKHYAGGRDSYRLILLHRQGDWTMSEYLRIAGT